MDVTRGRSERGKVPTKAIGSYRAQGKRGAGNCHRVVAKWLLSTGAWSAGIPIRPRPGRSGQNTCRRVAARALASAGPSISIWLRPRGFGSSVGSDMASRRVHRWRQIRLRLGRSRPSHLPAAARAWAIVSWMAISGVLVLLPVASKLLPPDADIYQVIDYPD